MYKRIVAAALSAACILCAPAHAGLEGNELSRRLTQEGQVLHQQGRIGEALAKFEAAIKADDTASMPRSSLAHLLATLIGSVRPERKEPLRQQAVIAAQAALQRFPNDPLAHEVLRSLDDDAPLPLHEPNAAAAKAHADAELAFARKDWQAALAHYRTAMAADPRHSVVWVGAGDCHFAQQQWPEAEKLYREATVIEPRNSQAWRFLADALAHQGRLDEAVAALEAGIAAHPAQRPNWDKLNAALVSQGRPALTRLDLKPVARLVEKDGRKSVNVDPTLLKVQGGDDLAIAIVQAGNTELLRKEHPGISPYQLELASWRKAFAIADEMAAKPEARGLKEPALLILQKLYRANQLDAAILLLRYREAYRADLESWLASRPHGVREFVATWSLRP